MADRFEARLEQMFAQPPAFADEAAFAERVQGRLGKGQKLRNVLIGVAGAVGGCVAVAQALNSNLAGTLQNAEAAAEVERASLVEPLREAARDSVFTTLWSDAVSWLPAGALGTEVMWTVAGLAIAGLALLTARRMGEA